MNIVDRFLYKLLIMTFLLFAVVGLDYLNVIKLEDLKNEMSTNINFLRIAQKLNGGAKIIFIDTEDVTSVSGGLHKIEKIENGKRYIIDNYEGVECQQLGTVVDIKDNVISILGTDNVVYVYKNLISVDVNLYQVVRKNQIIGRATEKNNVNYFDLYCIKENKYINIE